MFDHQLSRLSQVGGRLHEAERDDVDADGEAEPQVVDVLRRDRRGRERHAGSIDALVLAERPAIDHGRANLGAVALVDSKFYRAVGDEQSIAGPHTLRQLFTRRRNPAGAADDIAGDDAQRVARLQGERTTSFEPAGANLWSAEVLKDRDFALRARGRRAHTRQRGAMRLVRGVRKIQTEDVGPAGDQLIDRRVGVARRPERRNDLRVPH